MISTFSATPLILGALIALAVVAPTLTARLGRGALAVFAAVLAGLAGYFAAMLPALASGAHAEVRLSWIEDLGLSLDFRLDVLAAVMCLVITGIGALVLVYSVRYFPPRDDGLPKFAGSIVSFAAAMLALVLADNLIVLVACWELTGILSYLLIAHRVRKRDSRQAASQALMVTTAGGLTLLVGAIGLGVQAGTFTISAIVANPPSGPLVVAAVVAMLVGGISKSAIVPFHFWLPGAMAAPTPASAYLHAATMVKAGIYLFARFAPAFGALGLWRPMLFGLGAVTMMIAAALALRAHDLKLLLAYGTVSQLGLMTMLTGGGTPEALVAALAMLIGHATFKGTLFFVVGIVDTAAGSRDIRQLSGIGRARPWLAVVAGLAALSMAGLPPMVGFVAKEAGFAGLLGAEHFGMAAALVMAAGSALTVAYTARFCWGAFARKPGRADSVVEPISWWLGAPTVVLMAAGLVLGIVPGPLDQLLRRYGVAAGGSDAGSLARWHGFGLPVVLTTAALVLGVALFALQRRIEVRRGRLVDPNENSGAVYRAMAVGVDRLAVRVTLGTSRGSLPVSLGAILAVLVTFPGVVLLLSSVHVADVSVAASVPQAIALCVIGALAVAVLRAARPIGAVLITGGVGYAIAIFYVVRGAPDLALTQLLVETITLIAAVLVLVRLPKNSMNTAKASVPARTVRIVLAVSVGALMASLALVIPGQRRAAAVLVDRLQEIVDVGGGHNIVNVILVDVRGWDTFGEISVLVAAAVGVSSLVFVRNPTIHRRRRDIARRHRTQSISPVARWLPTVTHTRGSLLLDVATRSVFHIIIVFSVYVLFVGHDEPGGGFAAGLIVGIALSLRYLAGGADELAFAAPIDAGRLMGLGLVVASASAAAGLVTGGAALRSWQWHADVPMLGEVTLASSAIFDVGVYLVVIGVVLEVLRSFGGELDRQASSKVQL